MTCKACGRPFGCEHTDPEYQGIVPPMIRPRSISEQVEEFVVAVNRAAKQVGEAFRR